jgi:hypothetical protein
MVFFVNIVAAPRPTPPKPVLSRISFRKGMKKIPILSRESGLLQGYYLNA